MKKNIFEKIPKQLPKELFEEILKSDSLSIERIVSYGHITDDKEWYDQVSNEWVMLLQGKAILSFEGEEDVSLKVGDYINIPAHKKHRVAWTQEDTQTIWLAIHY